MSPDSPQKVTPSSDFAKRLKVACESHPHAPSGHGRQKWLREQLRDIGIKVSPEAVRKWFAGEAQPRPATMRKVASTLDVDLGWLSFGLTPNEMPPEKRKRSAIADGVVNLVAGAIQMSGGHIAFPATVDSGIDLYAIIGGRQYAFQAKLVRPSRSGESLRVAVARDYPNAVVIGVVPGQTPLQSLMVLLPTAVIEAQGRHRGGFVDVEIERAGSAFLVGGEKLPQIRSFSHLDREIAKASRSV